VLAARGAKEQARGEYRKAADLAPGLVEAHREIARAASGARDWETAIAELKNVLIFKPDDQAARDALAVASKSQTRDR
jgi:hypothetical protein